MKPMANNQHAPEEVRVEPIKDDDRERLRELLLQVQDLVADDD